jgi:hypothetical protein
MRRQTGYIRRQERIFSEWGDTPIGTAVTVEKDDGTEVQTKTRSKAWMLAGHTAVVMVEGITGCYALERIKKEQK